jgi:hypothetical protein
MTRTLALLTVLAGLALGGAPAAMGAAPQPPLDITKLPYQPIGHFKPGEAIPPDVSTACEQVAKPLMNGKIFNPSGTWNAFDTNVFETLCLPFRNQDDTSIDDPWGNGGNGETRHGYCAGANPQDPMDPGVCPNHQLEFIDYYKATMLEILKDFAPAFHQYDFEHPEGTGRNPAVVVAGADNPEESIIIGSHYDQTTTGPASTWDSQEGHAEMIRVAKLMVDYWKATGTRPSATIKFMPMDGEEDGTLGSAAYVSDHIVPEQESKVRGYWNADPCAGGYPARRYGNPSDMVPINVQIGDSTDARVVKFNEGARKIVEDVFDHLDDKITSYPDQPEVFVSTAEGLPGAGGDVDRHVFVTKEHPVLFSSDWRNFIAVNIPFFNPSPKVTGPSNGADPSPLTLQGNTPDAVVGFHTPIDNLQTMSRYTGQSPLGDQWPEAWIKGMEMCSHMLAYGMLQPHQGGAQTASTDVVAYYEATPNEAERGRFVTFDGGGSHQYADVASRALVPDAQLQFKWQYGDGRTAFGKVVKHAYRETGTYTSKLTVTNRQTGRSATMSIPVVVEDGTGADVDPNSQDSDNVPAQGSVVACKSSAGFTKLTVTPAGNGLRFDFARAGGDQVKISVFRASDGRRAGAAKRVAAFSVTEPFTWKPKGKLAKGDYYAVVSVVQPNNQLDRRTVALQRAGAKFKLRKPFTRTDSCDLISLYRLSSPAFGGRRALGIAFVLTQPGSVTVRVVRGKRTVRTIRTKIGSANRSTVLRLPARGLRKGDYAVRITAVAGSARQTATLHTRKL